MAKWYPSSLIADIRGKLRNDVYTYYRGSHIIRTYNPNPANPQSERQQLVRGHFSTVASCWWGLDNNIREMWEKYASMSKSLRTGIGAFYRHNLRLLDADSPFLEMLTAPPFFPSTPHHVEGFDWTFFGVGANLRMTWTTPRDTNLWILGSYRLNWDYSPNYNVYWKQLPVRNSVWGFQDWAHPVNTGDEIFIRLRVLDEQGRISPVTHFIKRIVP